jgi:hypothetical protein
MRKLSILVGFLLLTAAAAMAQDYPTVETSPAFMYIHTSPLFGGSQSFNCAGGGGTLAYNFTNWLGVAADLGGCKLFSLSNQYGVGSRVDGNEFTYLFGPRLTYRSDSNFQPFAEVNFGGSIATPGPPTD